MNNIADIFNATRKRLFNFIRSKVATYEDAEDILQDVFYKLVLAENLAKPIEQTAAWLYKTAANRIIDISRKKKEDPLPSHYDNEEDDFIFDEIADIAFGKETTPETEFLRSVIFTEMQNAIAGLPKEQREVFMQTEILGMSIKEVAEKTNTPQNTVLSRKHYAVLELRERLRKLYDEVVGG